MQKIETTTLKQIVSEVLDQTGGSLWLSPEYIAEKLSFKSDTVRKWCREGTLPAKKYGRSWRIKAEDFTAFCQSR